MRTRPKNEEPTESVPNNVQLINSEFIVALNVIVAVAVLKYGNKN